MGKNTGKKTLSLLLSVVMVLGLFTFAPVEVSASQPRFIGSADELADFAAEVNGGESFAGVTVTLTTDIALSVIGNWTPIGTATAPVGNAPPADSALVPFSGSFDGGGFTIRGLTIDRPTMNFQGLFGVIGSGGSVMNLTLESVNITGQRYTGGVAGFVAHGGSIENVFVCGEVRGGNFTGGVTGHLFGTVTRSGNSADVTARGTEPHSVGGIAGRIWGGGGQLGRVSQSFNTGDITNTSATNPGEWPGSRTGGIAGVAEYQTPRPAGFVPVAIENSFNTGEITGTGQFTGGVVGYVWWTQADRTFNTGAVQGGTAHTGGITGAARGAMARVSNSAALNNSISGTGARRICARPDDGATLANNHARDDMLTNGFLVTANIGAAAVNGADAVYADIHTSAFWETTLDFDPAVWTLEDGRLPVLAGVFESEQNVTFPPSLDIGIDLSDPNPPAIGNGWTFNNNVYTIQAGANVTVTGTSANNRRLAVAANAEASITLQNATISLSTTSQLSPLLLNNGANLTLTLVGDNDLRTQDGAGINVVSGRTLTIGGTGSLTAQGGNRGAGIGGGGNGGVGTGGNGGTVTITGGTVIATGGSSIGGGAGIGGGINGNSGGNVTISGGNVTARAGGTGNSAAIGRGSGGSATAGTRTFNGTFNYWTNTTINAPAVQTGSGAFTWNVNHRFIRLVRTYNVTVTDGTGGGYFPAGDEVSITADARPGYVFAEWQIDPAVTFTASTSTASIAATFIMPAQAVTATAVFSRLPALTGTATIDNTAPHVGDVLTGSLVGGNNTGELTFRWLADGAEVQSGTGETYTVQNTDLGKAITLEITSSVQTGTVTSAETAAVTEVVAPDAPAITNLTPGDSQVTVEFTPPADDGGSPITGFTVTAMPGNITATGTSSPITVTGLTNGEEYTFTITATNSAGTGPPSAVSGPVTPEFGVPPTAVPNIAGHFAALLVLIMLSAVLWGFVLRRKLRRGNA